MPGFRALIEYWHANDLRFRNTEVLTIKDDHITDVEVYLGWSIPHTAQPGSFVDNSDAWPKHP